MTESSHPKVPHPNDILAARREQRKREYPILFLNSRIIIWITNHVLASVILFDIAFLVPLFTITAPSSVKITLGVISGSWIQWWALPALQRSQNRQQAQADAKADADHTTLTYLLNLQEKQMAELEDLKAQLAKLKE